MLRKYRFVDDWGEIVRMTERQYRHYLKDGSEGKNPTASKYGKSIGTIDMHTVDAKPEDFQAALEILNR